MELYAKDAAVSDSPWKFWEVYDPEADKWVTLRKNPEWAADKLYRQKPTQLSIEGVWFPVPYGEELTIGETYYLPETHSWWNQSGVHQVYSQHKSKPWA